MRSLGKPALSWLARVAALLTGAASVLAYAPFDWRPLSILATGALFWLWLGSDAREAFKRGYLFGLGLFGVGASWVYVSIRIFGQSPLWLAGGLTVAFVATLALFPAAAGWLVNRYVPAGPARRLLIAYPAAWVLLEWARSWVLTGFPWMLLAQAQLDTPLAGIVPVLGELGASALAALTAGLIVWGVRRPVPRTLVTAVVGIASVWVGSSLLLRVHWSEPEGEPIRVSLIQGNIPQDVKWDPEFRNHTLETYLRLTAEHWDSKLIVWPESAVPAYYAQAEEFLDALGAVAADKGSVLLTGIFHYDPEHELSYNAFVGLGAGHAFYYKQHLVPFGEYMPFRTILNWLSGFLVIPMADLTPGNGRPLMKIGPYALGMSICYEDAYGPEMTGALPEAQILINGSNDAWFGDSLAPHQHLEVARLRALETGRYFLRATNTGISAVIGPHGEVVARSPQFQPYVVTAEAELRRGQTPFSRTGPWPVVLTAGLLLSLAIWAMRGKGRAS